MRNVIFFALFFSLLFVSSCAVESETECDEFTPCPTGFTCDLLNGVCIEDTSEVDTETVDDALPTQDNEVQDKTEPEQEQEKEVNDDSETLCEPDMLLGCDPNDFHNIHRCNSSGTGVISVPCGGTDVCHEDKCEQINCEAGEGMCSESDMTKVFECDEKGLFATKTVLEDCGQGGYCMSGKCVYYCDIAAKEHSYQGCDYFTAFLDTRTQRSDPVFAIVIANTNLEKTATVSVTVSTDGTAQDDAGKCVYCDDEISSTTCMLRTSAKDLHVQPGKIGIIQFPHDRMLKKTGKSWNSYHIQSNLPVTVYQFSPIDNSDDNPFTENGKSADWSMIELLNNGRSYSNDASLLIPSTSVYSNYMAVTFKSILGQTAAGTTEPWPSYITVIGVSDEELDLVITPAADIVAGEGISAITANTDYDFKLKKYQVYNFETDELKKDLTGSSIRCKDSETNCGPFVVFSGNASTVIPNDKGYADHLEQQLFPIETWGKDYFLVKSKVKQDEYDYARIIASEDSTTITYSPQAPSALAPYTSSVPATTLNAGEWTEFYFKGSYSIKSDKPIMLTHFLTGANMISVECESSTDANYHAENCPGDPAMMLIPSSEQYRKDYIFLTPGSYKTNYSTIVAESGTKATLNGTDLTDFTEIGTSGYSYKIVDLGSDFARHSLVCDKPCGLYVYGWEADVSYAYPGGLNLENLSSH